MQPSTARRGQYARGLAEAAQAAAERGWQVFPVRPGVKKPPAVRRWEQRATADADRIARCWAHDAYNIGIATGPSGLVIIDLDVPHGTADRPPSGWDASGVVTGWDALALLAERHGQRLTLDTFTVATPTGGTHLYYTAPPGAGLRNTNGHPTTGGGLPATALGWLIDTRAGGGYVIAPGSTTPTGAYTTANDAPAAPLPTWLATLLSAPPPTAPHLSACPPTTDDTVRNHGAYATQALKGEAERVRAARTGGRNHALNKAAWNLGRLITRGDLTDDAAYSALRDAAAVHIGTNGFTDREADATIRAAFCAAAQRAGSAA